MRMRPRSPASQRVCCGRSPGGANRSPSGSTPPASRVPRPAADRAAGDPAGQAGAGRLRRGRGRLACPGRRGRLGTGASSSSYWRPSSRRRHGRVRGRGRDVAGRDPAACRHGWSASTSGSTGCSTPASRHTTGRSPGSTSHERSHRHCRRRHRSRSSRRPCNVRSPRPPSWPSATTGTNARRSTRRVGSCPTTGRCATRRGPLLADRAPAPGTAHRRRRSRGRRPRSSRGRSARSPGRRWVTIRPTRCGCWRRGGDRVAVMVGRAGTGKTHTLGTLRAAYEIGRVHGDRAGAFGTGGTRVGGRGGISVGDDRPAPRRTTRRSTPPRSSWSTRPAWPASATSPVSSIR